jgi:hypothetical protein
MSISRWSRIIYWRDLIGPLNVELVFRLSEHIKQRTDDDVRITTAHLNSSTACLIIHSLNYCRSRTINMKFSASIVAAVMAFTASAAPLEARQDDGISFEVDFAGVRE